MKCNKCGEECGANQTFCLKCGNRIHSIPDLNLIEEELANNIGELMDEMEAESNSDIGGTTRVFDGRVEIEEDILNDERYTSTQDITIPDIKDESLELIEIARKHNSYNDFQVNALNTGREKNVKKPPVKKKKTGKIIAGVVAGVIAITVIVIALVLIFGNKSPKEDTFLDIYNEGIELYTAAKYDEAVNSFQKAVNMAKSDKEIIDANKALYDAYMNRGFVTLSESEIHECVDILKELISLEKDNKEHYENLIKLYTKAEMESELESFKESLIGTEIGLELGIKSVAAPIFENEPGEYKEYMDISIMYEKGCTVYYTLDGSEPDTNSTVYEEPIEIKEQGTYEIKAVAVDEEGEMSDVVTAEFTFKLEAIEPPKVTPSGGTYKEATKIEVEVPEGMKAYYTIDEYGVEPTTESEEYTEPIDMPRGKYVFSVILVDESGMSSAVVENIYKYEEERKYSYDEAYDVLIDELIVNGTILDESGVTEDDGLMEFSYREIAIIENKEYYLIEGVLKSSYNKIMDSFIYGIDTVSGDMVSVSVSAEGDYEIN
ncbi:MAG: hypothetical protein E7270_06950 [Lachnospiraceae bacterium]|nr:hypothetical protein [Lachnospiraceae bacterium]